MEDEEIILPPDPARVMEGLRDTGYDFNTAMADIIDNSIAAEATKIAVQIEKNPFDNQIFVYVADNGYGMNMEDLKNAMKYGSKERSDPSSLGKFGLGLKTASTAFCRQLSVLSKGSLSEYHKVQWDLDEITKINKWKLLTPEIGEEEINRLEQITDGKAGTLIIWKKVDRLLKTYQVDANRDRALKKLVEKLIQHCSMVYERFLDRNRYQNVRKIDLFINDTKIEPWDPFCRSEEKTRSLGKQSPEVDLPDEKKSKFDVEAFLLPRVEEFSTSEAKSKARISNDMEGFYIYRENRLIYHGDWLGMFVNDPHISLLRVDFSFDHTLDEAFNVDIKKSQIMLSEEIYGYLKDKFIPAPRREAENIYRKGNNAQIIKNTVGAHDSSNNNISSKANQVISSRVDVIDATSGKVQISNAQGSFTGTIKILEPKKNNELNVIPVESIDYDMLWEPTIVDGNHAVSINQSHPYYNRVYAPNINNSTLIIGMDSLLWSLSEAELSTYNDATKQQYEDMRIQVSRILKKLINDLPEADASDILNEEH